MRASLLLFLACLLLQGCTKAPQQSQGQAGTHSTITGIDVSRYQGKVDFNKLAYSGFRYVFIRATDGITYTDADFTANVTAARTAGLTIGAYHFYETDDDPQEQLANFKALVKLQTGDLPPVVDIERLHNRHDKKLVADLVSFLTGLEVHYGVKPVIYSGYNFSNRYLRGLGDYPLWLAEYQSSSPKLPTGWRSWTFWQWSQSGEVAGINGHVDLDRFNGDESTFSAILVQRRD